MNLWQSIQNLSKFEKMLWLFSLLAVSIGFSFASPYDWLTLSASFVGLTSLIFTAKGDVWGQILGIVFSLIYAIISYHLRYYGEMITYLGMTAPINAFSVYTWLKNPYAEHEVKVNQLDKKEYTVLLLVAVLVTILFYFILKAFGTANLEISTISVFTSFVASVLMLFRSPYYALAFAANDIILVLLWGLAALEQISYLPMVICFAIFLLNDVYGFISWNKIKKRQKEMAVCG